MSYLSFPWEQIGTMLRRLSLAGAAGNAAAWGLFAALGGSPLLLWGWLAVQKKSGRADLLLPVLSLTLFAGLWFLVNPSYIEACLFPAGAERMGKCVFGAAIDSVLLTWLLLRFLGSYRKMERRRLLRSLELLLGFYVALAGAAILLQGRQELLTAWETVGVNASAEGRAWTAALEMNRLLGGAGGRNMGLSRCFLVLQTICSYLPGLLELALCAAAVPFLHSCEQQGFHGESLRHIERLRNLSACFLGVTLCVNMAVNLLQLLFAGYLYNSSYVLAFPLKNIIFMLGILLLSRFWLEGKRLKEDNELFI